MKEVRDKSIETSDDIKSNIILDEKNNRILIGLKNGLIECWNSEKPKKLFFLKAHKSKVRYL